MQEHYSFSPRLFPPPVLNRLQYKKCNRSKTGGGNSPVLIDARSITYLAELLQGGDYLLLA